MTKLFNRLSMLTAAMLCSYAALAQEKPEMADVMRSNGKIYVVVAVCVTILIGLFVYVLNVERKIKKIEQHH